MSDESIRGHSGGLILVPVLAGGRAIYEDVAAILAEIAPGLDVQDQQIRISRTKDETLVPPKLEDFNSDEFQPADKTVLLLDDLIDRGETLRLAHRTLAGLSPKKLLTLVLVTKRRPSEMVFVPDYACFELNYNEEDADRLWLFGYGMDIQDELRDLDYIGEREMDIATHVLREGQGR